MPDIQFPNIPEYPGVPPLVRPISAAIASVPILAIGIGTLETVLGSAFQQAPRWGIFDVYGNRLGIDPNSHASIVSVLIGQLTGSIAPMLSTYGFDFARETRISDFPTERGSFASYNRAQMPADPVVTLSFDGTEDEHTRFLTALDAACILTDLYSMATPEIIYTNYSIERYRMERTAYRGATLLTVEVRLKKIRQTTLVISTVIVLPQSPIAAPQVSNGAMQAIPIPMSTLSSIFTKHHRSSGKTKRDKLHFNPRPRSGVRLCSALGVDDSVITSL